MLNDLFKKYLNRSFSEIQIDKHHKKALSHRLFSQNSPDLQSLPSFWTWSKALFTAPVVALIAIVFVLTSNKDVIQAVLPQEALAQAVENAFQLDSFETTFGLPNDGKFYHRLMTRHTYDPIDPMGSATETTQLWTDGKSMRRDTSFITDDHTFKSFSSSLIDTAKDIHCNFELYFECESLSKFNETQAQDFLSNKSTYYPLEKESLISDLSIKPIFDTPKGQPVFALEWSTKTPMTYVNVWSGRDFFGAAGGGSGTDEKNNIFKDGKYWQKAEINIDLNLGARKLYFQVTDVDPLELGPMDKPEGHASMIYSIDRDTLEISPVTPDLFLSELKKMINSTEVTKDLYYVGLGSMIFFLKQDHFSHPISDQLVEIEGEKFIRLRYNAPEEGLLFMYIEPHPNDHYYVDLFMDETQTHFRGYKFTKNEQELETIWIKDEVLPNDDKPSIFEQLAWKDSLKDQYEAKEAERQQYIEDRKMFEETGDAAIRSWPSANDANLPPLVLEPPKPSSSLDEFTSCLAERGVKLYGTFWCPHCQDQKALFGNSAAKLPYVECSTPDGEGQTPVCKENKVNTYPSWILSNGEHLEGSQNLKTLSEKTNCELPTGT